MSTLALLSCLGEVDTRFSFCALASLTLLGQLHSVNVAKSVQFVLSCMNFDGGFGSMPGSESHAGQVSVFTPVNLWAPSPPLLKVYCCVGALALAGALYHVDADRLGWWLSERQLPSGGLNGNGIHSFNNHSSSISPCIRREWERLIHPAHHRSIEVSTVVILLY